MLVNSTLINWYNAIPPLLSIPGLIHFYPQRSTKASGFAQPTSDVQELNILPFSSRRDKHIQRILQLRGVEDPRTAISQDPGDLKKL